MLLMIDAGVAPIALRIPISLVRSFTTISMMLLTPTMPANKVPIPTIQRNAEMPSNKPRTCWNSASRLNPPMPRGSLGAT